jgi:Spy/CpxP family protein refolding chaperone
VNVRLRPVLTALLLFLSGGALTLLVEHTIVRPPAPAPPEPRHRAILSQMDSTLQLTAAQRDSIHAIFARHQVLIDSAWRSIHERLSAAMDSVHHELEAVLEPDQVAAFRQWMRHQHGGS